MTGLWIAITLSSLVVAAIVLWPLKRQRNSGNRSDYAVRRAANITLFQEHIAELDRDLEAGRILPEQHQQLQLEAQRNLLADEEALEQNLGHRSGGRIILVVTAAVLVVAGIGLYLLRGNAPDVYLAERHAILTAADMADFEREVNPGPARTRELLGMIESRVKTRPNNAQYWYLLTRYAMALGELDTAEKGLREIYRLQPGDASNTAQLAQILFLRGNNTITDEIDQLARQALMSDPEEQTALGLAGISAYQRGEFIGAIGYWQRAVNLLPANSDTRQALLSGIERARAMSGEDIPQPTGSQWRLPVEISLDDSLPLPADATLFVLVREVGQGPMPLLVTRLPASEIPASIIMSETMAMTTIERLTQAEQIEVVARISLTGNATPAPGDIQCVSNP
ncbi:MAG TPA: c-type cytochrome biogenesis protein CcmI, partial [Cellvibrionaceae bacterium]